MANPTTNYGFVLPTSTDLVTDLPADFDIALQGVDTRLKALQPGTASGDLAYSSATANTNVRLPIGTAGQVLAVVAGVPAWAAPAGGGGGKVLQVVQGTTTTAASNSTSTYADSGLTATITPSAATSKILVFFSQNGGFKEATGNSLKIRLLRGATELTQQTAGNSLNLVVLPSMSNSILDSPNTTSAVTYKTQFANTDNSTGTQVQIVTAGVATRSSIILMEIGA